MGLCRARGQADAEKPTARFNGARIKDRPACRASAVAGTGRVDGPHDPLARGPARGVLFIATDHEHCSRVRNMNTSRLSPQQAAERASVSRATIVRALQSRELPGIRGNNGRWSIDLEQLDRWSQRRAQTVHVPAVNSDHAAQIEQLSAQLESARQQLAEQAERLARLDAEAAATAARLADTAADRDEWRAQAQRLAERSAPQPAEPDRKEQPTGFRLFRLFRRSG